MKKIYIKPEIETILLENEEIIAMSNGGVPGPGDPENPGMNGVKRRSLFDE